jgi:hypothetical protein
MRIRITPSMAVALAALVLAAGGTSYAAAKLPAKSVGTPQLKPGAVTAPKLAEGAVASQLHLMQAAGQLPDLPPHSGATVHGDCPSGLSPIGGGIQMASPSTQYAVDGYPQGTGWTVDYVNEGDGAAGGTMFIVCADVGSNG